MINKTAILQVEARGNFKGVYIFRWSYAKDGPPIPQRAETYRKRLNRSFRPGGENDHFLTGFDPVYISQLSVINKDTGETLVRAIGSDQNGHKINKVIRYKEISHGRNDSHVNLCVPSATIRSTNKGTEALMWVI